MNTLKLYPFQNNCTTNNRKKEEDHDFNHAPIEPLLRRCYNELIRCSGDEGKTDPGKLLGKVRDEK